MKSNKIAAMLLALLLTITLCSCGGSGSSSSPETESTPSSEENAAVTEDDEEAALFLLEVNGETLKVQLEDNDAAKALKDLIGTAGLNLELKEYGGFEKVGPLPETLPSSDEQMDTSPGDIVLYQGNQLSLFYGENSWTYTRLGRVIDADESRLQEILGAGDVHVTLKLSD